MTISGENTIKTKPDRTRKFIRIIFQLLFVLVILAGLLFIPSGRLDWVNAWVYLIAYGILLFAYSAWGLFKDPGQFEERSRASSANVKPWDKVILTVYTILLLMLFVVCGLDAGRFQWSHIPVVIRAFAWLGLAIAGGMIFWALATNTYLSPVARIQSERGQVVITSGPYQFVRHPMYLGSIIFSSARPSPLDHHGD